MTRAGATAVEVSPDGTTFAVAAGDRVLRYDTVTLQQRGPALTGHRGTLRDVTFSHDGGSLATSSDDRNAIVWDARTGEQVHRFVGGGPLGVAFSADDATLFTAGAEGLLLARNVAGRQLDPRRGQQHADRRLLTRPAGTRRPHRGPGGLGPALVREHPDRSSARRSPP